VEESAIVSLSKRMHWRISLFRMATILARHKGNVLAVRSFCGAQRPHLNTTCHLSPAVFGTAGILANHSGPARG
jgi:hypothetical protein